MPQIMKPHIARQACFFQSISEMIQYYSTFLRFPSIIAQYNHIALLLMLFFSKQGDIFHVSGVELSKSKQLLLRYFYIDNSV